MAKGKNSTARKSSRRDQRTRAAKRAASPRIVAKRGGLFASLKPNPANYVPLTPISFLPRSAEIHPERLAVIHGARRFSYRQFHERAQRLASALAKRGIRAGDTVSAMLPNVPAMIEAHHGVPLLGAVLNAINTRLDAATVAYIL